MAVIALPPKFSFTNVGKLKLQRASNILRSRYTGQSQRILYPFAVWQFEGTLVDYDGLQAAAIRAFFVALEGTKNTFRLPIPGYSNPSSGIIDSNMAIDVAAASRATSIQIKLMNVSTTVLVAGEYFMLNDELKVATSDLVSNASGIGTVQFQPPLRAAATVGNLIIINNPTCLMHAADDDVASWGIKPPNRHGLNLEAIEAVTI